jgi:hypothetical protein
MLQTVVHFVAASERYWINSHPAASWRTGTLWSPSPRISQSHIQWTMGWRRIRSGMATSKSRLYNVR